MKNFLSHPIVVNLCLASVIALSPTLRGAESDAENDKASGEEVALQAALKKLQAEKAPAAQGNTEEAETLCKMLAMVLSMASPDIPQQADKPEPRAGQRHYCHFSSAAAGGRCAILIHREGLDRMTADKRDFFLGMCVGMAEGAAARAPSVKELAIAVVWNGKVQWVRIAKMADSGSGEDEEVHDKAVAARAALLPFFATDAAE